MPHMKDKIQNVKNFMNLPFGEFIKICYSTLLKV